MHYLRPADVGRVHYEITVADEARSIDVGTAAVVSVADGRAEVRLTSDRQVLPGFTVRFEVPYDRVQAAAESPTNRQEASPAAQAAVPAPVLENEAPSDRVAGIAELQARLDAAESRQRELQESLDREGAARQLLETQLAELRRLAADGDRLAEEGLDRLDPTTDRLAEPEPPVETPEAEPVAEHEPQASAATPPAAEPTKDSEAAVPPTSAQLESRVREWAAAWSMQDVQTYLSLYAPEFSPPDGMPRKQWEDGRTERLNAAEFIEIGIDAFELLSATAERAQVRFEQSYQSNTFQDRVVKTLVLVPAQGEWKIAMEEVR